MRSFGSEADYKANLDANRPNGYYHVQSTSALFYSFNYWNIFIYALERERAVGYVDLHAFYALC